MNYDKEDVEHIHINYADKNRTEPPTDEEMEQIKKIVREVKEKRDKVEGEI